MSSNPSVIYAGNFKYPKENAAGKRVLGNVKALEMAGYDVTVFDFKWFINQRKKSSSILARIVPSFVKDYFSLQKQLNQKPEGTTLILYGTCSNSIFSFLMLSYCKRKNIKIVADCVDFLTIKTKNPIFDLLKRTDELLLKKYSYRKYDGVIGISNYIANVYKDKVNTVVIPPLNDSQCSNVKAKPVSNLKTFIYSGVPFRADIKTNDSSAMKDRLDVVIEAFLECEANGELFNFLIVGLSEKQFVEKFPRFEAGLATSQQIFFKGMLPSDEAEEISQMADISVLVRDRKQDTEAGFPTKIVDSISAGVPALVSPVGDIPEYLTDLHDCYFVENNNVEYISNLITEIIATPENMLSRVQNNCTNNEYFKPHTYKSRIAEFIKSL